MERVYDRTMFHGARFADLKKNGRPLIAIGGTDIAYGSPFLFTQDTFDLICSDLDDLPVARRRGVEWFPGTALADHADQPRGGLWRTQARLAAAGHRGGASRTAVTDRQRGQRCPTLSR
jgi:hypothetical protein